MMLRISNCLKLPEYVFRPSQILRRFIRIVSPPRERETIILPWGAPVTVHLNDHIGAAIIWHGVFDRNVPEAIARLIDPGELGVDIGANIGQNCSLMAAAAGPEGRVIAFDPHPVIFDELQANRRQWPTDGYAPIQLEQVALGEKTGEAVLDDGEDFSFNRGCAKLADAPPETDAASERTHTIHLKPLDDFLSGEPGPAVVKLDVESAELRVLEGAARSLRDRLIRDLIYEDFGAQPSELAQRLRDAGFTLFAFQPGWSGPGLATLDENWSPPPDYSCNFLATLDPERAERRYRPRGWHCLRSAGAWKRRHPRN